MYKLELAGLVARAKCARVARISSDDGQQPGLLFDARLGDLLIVGLLDTFGIAWFGENKFPNRGGRLVC
jgi:hypothetical protein